MNTPGSNRVAVLTASWHESIVNRARDSFCKTLTEGGIAPDLIDHFVVPGSLEIPFLGKKLAATGNYCLLAGIGFVVDGGIYRHEFVANAVINNLVKVSVDEEIPFLSMILTPHTDRFDERNEEHQQFFYDHMLIKGEEGGNAALSILATVRDLQEGAPD